MLIVIRYKHSSWNLEPWESLACMKSGPFSIENLISSSLKVILSWFKILWKEEKKISKFDVGHFFQFPSLLREKGETISKLHLISNVVKSDLSSLFHLYLGLHTPIEVVLIRLESLLKDLQLLFLLLRANSNYFDYYRAWKCVKEVSTIRQ